jgi:hypothetical protein
MCTNSQFFSDTGMVNIATANPNLNGSGVLGTVLVALPGNTSSKGTIVSSITIKATGSTTEGMVRLFIDDGTTKYLYKEIYVPAVTQTSVQPAFLAVLNDELILDPGTMLKASTQKSESFNVVANASAWKDCVCDDVSPFGEIQYFANTGLVHISTPNSNLNGTGPLSNIIIASNSGPLSGGTQVPYVTVKATASSSLGMVRIFISDGTNNFLIREIQIPQASQTAVEPTFRGIIPLEIFLKPNHILKASTQNADGFNLIAAASDWLNCDCPLS